MAVCSRGSVILIAAVCLGGIVCPPTSSAPTLSTHTPLADGIDRVADQTGDNPIAVDNELCQEAGERLLNETNNAVDAAVATLLCLGVVNFQSSGIGGGMVMVVAEKDPNGGDPTVTVIDARVVAPQSVMQGEAYSKEGAKYGPSSITVPGELRGMKVALDMFSNDNVEKRMALFKDAIRHAEEGFKPSNHLLSAINCSIKDNTGTFHSHQNSPWFRNLKSLLQPNGEYIEEGDTIPPRPELANTLRAIVNNGFHEFYNGTVAANLTRDINSACALNPASCRGLMRDIISAQDLEAYQVRTRVPFNFSYDSSSGYEVYTAPAPYGGSALAIFLGIVTRKVNNVSSEDNVYHYLTEAAKFAASHRMLLGDPDSEVGNMKANVSPQAAEEKIREILAKLNGNGAKARPANDLSYYDFEMGEADDDLGTTHLSVVTPAMAVSVTSSINDYFGSGFLSPSTGVILNNDMDAFSLDNRFRYNQIHPGRRPLSAMCPTVVVDSNGDFKLVTGAAGGTRIPPAVGQTMFYALTRSKSAKEATCQPRVYAKLDSDEQIIIQDVEMSMGENSAVPAFPCKILQALQNVTIHNQPMYEGLDRASSSVQSILAVSGIVQAHSDVRKYGGMCDSACTKATQCLICTTTPSTTGSTDSTSPNWGFHPNVKLLLIFISFILQYVCIYI